MAKVVLATSQFKIEKDVEKNLISIKHQMKKAKAGAAHLIHFSEGCLSGYLGAEIKSLQKIDWGRVKHPLAELPVKGKLEPKDMGVIRSTLKELGYID